MLGIIIGVWSVISALALAAGVQQSIMAQMSSLGTNLLTVTPGLRGSGGRHERQSAESHNPRCAGAVEDLLKSAGSRRWCAAM